MHVDESIKGGRKKPLKIFIVLDLSDPAPMSMHFHTFVAFFTTFILCWPLIFQLLALLLCLLLLVHLRLVLLLLSFLATAFETRGSTLILALTSGLSATLLVRFSLIDVVLGQIFSIGISVLESLMLPLPIVVVSLDVLRVTGQIRTIFTIVSLVLTDMPVGLVEVVHGDDAKIVTE